MLPIGAHPGELGVWLGPRTVDELAAGYTGEEKSALALP